MDICIWITKVYICLWKYFHVLFWSFAVIISQNSCWDLIYGTVPNWNGNVILLKFFIPDYTGNCDFDNFWCSQCWKFHENRNMSVTLNVIRVNPEQGNNFPVHFSIPVPSRPHPGQRANIAGIPSYHKLYIWTGTGRPGEAGPCFNIKTIFQR